MWYRNFPIESKRKDIAGKNSDICGNAVRALRATKVTAK
jgi:hypothetical protein